jgi:hypothetical protein
MINIIAFLISMDSRIIREIAQNIDCGEITYYNHKSRKIVSLADLQDVLEKNIWKRFEKLI